MDYFKFIMDKKESLEIEIRLKKKKAKRKLEKLKKIVAIREKLQDKERNKTDIKAD